MLIIYHHPLIKFANAASKPLPVEIMLMCLQDAALQDKELLAAYHHHLHSPAGAAASTDYQKFYDFLKTHAEIVDCSNISQLSRRREAYPAISDSYDVFEVENVAEELSAYFAGLGVDDQCLNDVLQCYNTAVVRRLKSGTRPHRQLIPSDLF